MKRLTSLVLALLLAVGVLVTPAKGAGAEYTFTLTVNGGSSATAEVGDTVTVAVRLKCNSKGSFDLYAMQAYINIDPAYLEYIHGSESFYSVGGYPVTYGNILPGGRQVLTNYASVTPLPMENDAVLMTFRLRALQEGALSIYCTDQFVTSPSAEKLPTDAVGASLTIRGPHVHHLTSVPEKPATEEAAGVKAHWVCTDCGKTFFDQGGSRPATEQDLLLPRLNHVHAPIHVAGVASTEHVSGMREHWKCKGCGKIFADEACTEELTEEELLLPKLDHVHVLTPVPKQFPTGEKEGMQAHWVCVDCGKLFLDEKGEREVTAEELVIPKVVPEEHPLPILPDGGGSKPTGFTDVAPSAWYADAVRWAVSAGVTSGISPTTFGPDMPCTRAQAVTFLWRAAGSPAPMGSKCSFTDVPEGAYYRNAVLWAVEKGVTSGTSPTTFSPDTPCTRSQIVTFLWRSKGSPAVTGAVAFADVAPSAWYADAVLWAGQAGITSGTSPTTFSPESPCTRGHIVTFLYRAV